MNSFLQKFLLVGALLCVSAAPANATQIVYDLDGDLVWFLEDGTAATFVFNPGATLSTDSVSKAVSVDGTATLAKIEGGSTRNLPSDILIDLNYANATFLGEGITVGSNSHLVDGSVIGGLSLISAKFLDPTNAPSVYQNYGSQQFSFVADATGFGYHGWFMGTRLDPITGEHLDAVVGDFHAKLTPRSSEVPEPTTAALLGIAAAGGMWKRRRATA